MYFMFFFYSFVIHNKYNIITRLNKYIMTSICIFQIHFLFGYKGKKVPIYSYTHRQTYACDHY